MIVSVKVFMVCNKKLVDLRSLAISATKEFDLKTCTLIILT